MSDNKPTIEAKRRRPGGPSEPSGRAEAPSRRQPGSGSGGQPPAFGGGGSQGSGLPGGLPGKLTISGILLLVVGFLVEDLDGNSQASYVQVTVR